MPHDHPSSNSLGIFVSRLGHRAGFSLGNTDWNAVVWAPRNIFEVSPLEMSEFMEKREKYIEVHKNPVDAG